MCVVPRCCDNVCSPQVLWQYVLSPDVVTMCVVPMCCYNVCSPQMLWQCVLSPDVVTMCVIPRCCDNLCRRKQHIYGWDVHTAQPAWPVWSRLGQQHPTDRLWDISGITHIDYRTVVTRLKVSYLTLLNSLPVCCHHSSVLPPSLFLSIVPGLLWFHPLTAVYICISRSLSYVHVFNFFINFSKLNFMHS